MQGYGWKVEPGEAGILPEISGLMLFAFFLGVLTPLPISAQTESTGAISGTVRDQSGVPVPKVLIKITLRNTDAVREVLSDEEGRYTANLLTPGTYTVRVELSGFQTVVLDPVIVRVTEHTTADAEMKVGAGESQTIVVTGHSPSIDTTTATKGQVIEETSIRHLPLPTLNYQQLLALSPGTSASLSNNTDVGRGDLNISVNGQRTTSNNMTMNGTEVIGPGTNSTMLAAVPAPDTLEQFIVQTSLFNATSGRNSGGNVAVITKSGTNEFHGTFYEFLRNRILNANDFFRRVAHVGAGIWPRTDRSRQSFAPSSRTS